MEKTGDIFLKNYGGWYSVRDEAFYAEGETVVGPDNVRRGPQGSPVEWTEEETYFFKLSAYQDKLLAYYDAHPDFILPPERRNEVVSFVKGGLEDLSISRTTIDWGIPVPAGKRAEAKNAASHVMYVWVDALTNYLTGVGFPDETDDLWRFWPADVHVIGKDILRFHAVYWPAFLMSAGVELPGRVFSHGFVLSKGEKMSKSIGNVVDPFDLVHAYGLDPVRYFFLREVNFGHDGNYSPEAIANRINADLANDLGNLAQRSLSMIAKNCGGKVPEPGDFTEADRQILAGADALYAKAREAMDRQAVTKYLDAVWAIVADANRYFAGEEPWAKKKTDFKRMETILYVTAEVVRQIAILAAPVMPHSAEKLLVLLGQADAAHTFKALGAGGRLVAGTPLPEPAGVFPRYVEEGAGEGAPEARRQAEGEACETEGGKAQVSKTQAMKLVDHHCHLDFPQLAEDREGLLARAKSAGVGVMVTISTRIRRLPELLAIAEAHDNIYCSVGTHPHNAHEELDIPLPEIVRLSRHPKVVAIGEAGLDYFYKHSTPEAQAEGFRRHIAAARETGLPLEIHTRDADADTATILEDEHAKGAFPAILHCYTGGPDLASRALALGLYVSFTGVVTFKKSEALREIARSVPLDRLLVETDAPFLAPEPYRGKTNEPAYVVHTAAALAEVKGISAEELAAATTENFFRLFQKVPRSGAKDTAAA